jgi:hypothetical protein
LKPEDPGTPGETEESKPGIPLCEPSMQGAAKIHRYFPAGRVV